MEDLTLFMPGSDVEVPELTETQEPTEETSVHNHGDLFFRPEECPGCATMGQMPSEETPPPVEQEYKQAA